MTNTQNKMLKRYASNSNTPAGSPILFPQFLNMPWVHNVNFSATQMAFLRANPGVAVQISNYLIDAQPNIPQGNGNDPVVQTAAYKAETVKAFTGFLAEDADFAQANADAGFPAIYSDPWWMILLQWVGVNTEPYEKQYNGLSQKEKDILNTMPGSCYKIMISNKKAEAKIKILCPNTWARNNNADAFVHAYSCALAAKNGDPVATKIFTDAHEEKWAGYPALHLETQMDLHNNAVGIAIGSDPLNANISDAALATKIINAIQALKRFA